MGTSSTAAPKPFNKRAAADPLSFTARHSQLEPSRQRPDSMTAEPCRLLPPRRGPTQSLTRRRCRWRPTVGHARRSTSPQAIGQSAGRVRRGAAEPLGVAPQSSPRVCSPQGPLVSIRRPALGQHAGPHSAGVPEHPAGQRGRTHGVAASDVPRAAPRTQADSFARPLRRREERIDRPARVRMRSRKPWVLARRLLLGWNVRLDTTYSVHVGLARWGNPGEVLLRQTRRPPPDAGACGRRHAAAADDCDPLRYNATRPPGQTGPRGFCHEESIGKTNKDFTPAPWGGGDTPPPR